MGDVIPFPRRPEDTVVCANCEKPILPTDAWIRLEGRVTHAQGYCRWDTPLGSAVFTWIGSFRSTASYRGPNGGPDGGRSWR